MNNRIQELQKILRVEQSGFMDEVTKAGLRNLQLQYGIYPSGMLDEPTIDRIKNRNSIDLRSFPEHISEPESTTYNKEDNIVIPNMSTDLFEVYQPTDIKEHKLSPGQFINQVTAKKLIFLHHTAGNADPIAVVNDWNTDSRGAIGTHYVIGGENARNGDKKHDGKIVRCIDDKHYAYHLGGNLPSKLTSESIGIELCNFGWLTKRNGKFYTYVNSEVRPDQVATLSKPFRGYLHWHKYSSKQIDSLIKLLKILAKNHNIDIKQGIPNLFKSRSAHDALEINSTLMSGINYFGVWSHTNVRTDKSDIYPYEPLIEKLKTL